MADLSDGPTVVVGRAASFVAVCGAATAAPADGKATTQAILPTIEQRLRDELLAMGAASTTRLFSVTLLALAVGAGAIVANRWGDVSGAAVASLCVLLSVAPWMRRRRGRRAHATWPDRVPWMAAALIAMCGSAALGWVSLPAERPGLLWLGAGHAATVALAAAVWLPPRWQFLAFPAFLPLSWALAVWIHPSVDIGPWESRDALVAASLFASVAASSVFAWRFFAWRDVARARISDADRIQALLAERDTVIRADQEKSRFLAIASHDLRQPVHALGLFAATLEKRLQGTAEEPLARNMIRSIDGLDRSFNAMLDISRLDAGTIEPNFQHFPVRDLFRRLHMHFAGQAEMKGLGLRFFPGGKSVSSDPQLLERIVSNLVQNAIKYTEQGGVVVVARTTSTHINIEVWDTGVGIDAADLPRIFDEFYQVGRSKGARAQGLGMGLSIVKRLAQLLGHQLTVTSRPGRGTMFRVGVALGGLHDIQDATAAADTLPLPVSQARTVLILDDEEAILEGLRLLLEEWGYEAITAGSIDAAERALASLEILPDLILSDLHLGDGPDGIAAIAALRRQCGHDVAAILITGDTTHEEMRRVTESGHSVLFKPVQPRRLLNVLRGLLP